MNHPKRIQAPFEVRCEILLLFSLLCTERRHHSHEYQGQLASSLVALETKGRFDPY